LAGDYASATADASSALDAAFEDFQEVQNRNAEHWHRGSSVDVADELAETLYLKARIAEAIENSGAIHSDLGWADEFFRRAAEQMSRKGSFFHDALGAFRVRNA
jgi:hypothetical protein